MKQVRIRINDLIDQHGATFGNCPGCSICIEIHNLKEQLLEEPVDRFSSILQKGQDMTRSDIVFLLENEVRKKDIRKALGMTTNLFTEMLKNFGLSFEKKMKLKGVEKEMPKITHEEYRDLKAQGLSDKDIATRKVMAASYLSTLKKQWKEDATGTGNDVKTVQLAPREENNVSESTKKPTDKTSEFTSLIEDLQAALLAKDEKILELEGSLKKANSESDSLKAIINTIGDEKEAAYDKGAEIIDKASYEIDILSQQIQELHEELIPLRLLALSKLKRDLDAI